MTFLFQDQYTPSPNPISIPSTNKSKKTHVALNQAQRPIIAIQTSFTTIQPTITTSSAQPPHFPSFITSQVRRLSYSNPARSAGCVMLHCCVAMSQVPVAVVCLSTRLDEGKACTVRAAAKAMKRVGWYILEAGSRSKESQDWVRGEGAEKIGRISGPSEKKGWRLGLTI